MHPWHKPTDELKPLREQDFARPRVVPSCWRPTEITAETPQSFRSNTQSVVGAWVEDDGFETVYPPCDVEQ